MARPRLLITDPVSPQANRTSASTRPRRGTHHAWHRDPAPPPHSSAGALSSGDQPGLPHQRCLPIYARQDPALYPIPASPLSEAGVSLETARDLAGAAGGPWDELPFPATSPTRQHRPPPHSHLQPLPPVGEKSGSSGEVRS